MSKRKAVALFSKLLVVVAVMCVSTASYWLFHRPETPAELKR
jgi:cyclic lactone autoinducer peptide